MRTLYRERGRLYEARGDFDQAIQDYSEVIKTFIQGRADHWSDLVCDYFSRARACRVRGDYDGAIADYTAIIELYPTCVLAAYRWWVSGYYKMRGETYSDKGDDVMAIDDLTEANRLDPGDVLSISRRGEVIRAVGAAFDRGEVVWRRGHALTMLAAAHARSGNFDQARQYQRRFLELPDLAEEDVADGRKRLTLYDAGGSGGAT